MTVSTPTKTYPYDSKVAAIHKLRINVKSLAAEAKIIRQEAKRCGMAYEYALTLHRKGRLREEARVAHLALAYARSRAYRSAEPNTKELPLHLATAIGKKLAICGIVTTCLAGSEPGNTGWVYTQIQAWLKS